MLVLHVIVSCVSSTVVCRISIVNGVSFCKLYCEYCKQY